MARWFRAMWDGMRLYCPNCRRGRIYRSLFLMNPNCSVCGVAFEGEEGDFLGGIVIAYGVTAVVVVLAGLLLYRYTGRMETGQILVLGLLAAVFLVLFYRNMKGVWIGILHAMMGLVRK